MKFVLDVSNWDASTFDAACLKNEDVEGIILGYQIPSTSDNIAAKAMAAGIPVLGTYAFLWDVETPAIRVQKAIDGAIKCRCKYVWLDAEKGDNMPATVAQRVADVRAGVQAVRAAGLIPGIYCGQFFWQDFMGNTAEFSSLPLWLANWGVNDGNQWPILTVNFGGWKNTAVHQYASSIEICGRVRDTNYYFLEDAVVPGVVTREEFDELREIVMQLVRVTVGHGTPDPLDSLAGMDDDGINMLLYSDGLNAAIHVIEARLEHIRSAWNA